ncbi:hypothetical protein BLD44_004985 [Mastigocladus laminosus UU774]|nr:hypothetical protein BLD44_004985 [Mastigocladus laminosus UU774]
MGIGDWGSGKGDKGECGKCGKTRENHLTGFFLMTNPQSPIPNPQSSIPNPQSPIPNPQSQTPVILSFHIV